MDLETIRQQLAEQFQFTARQAELENGSYQLEMRILHSPPVPQVLSYRICLTGEDPLTGREVRCPELSWGFDFSCLERRSMELSFDGTFTLECEAILEDGRELLFRSCPLVLHCSRNAPRVIYSLRKEGAFTRLTLESNCRTREKRYLWLELEHHSQRVEIPPADSGRQSFYLPTSGEVTLEAREFPVQLERER